MKNLGVGGAVSKSGLEPLVAAMSALLAGDEDVARTALTKLSPPPEPQTSRRGIPVRTQAAVFQRDHYTCGYCGRLTICPPALRYLSERFPDLVPYHPHGKWDLTHPLYWEAYASCDHLVPLARGGAEDTENYVTSCYKCNTIKSSWLLEELGWARQPVPELEWDGLSGLFVKAMAAAPIDKPYFKTWLRALV
ncbi:MAG: HNH endonuclease [Chloroflexota bacterium]|nr:HNH endonuclease [Chloroflexota bacterium]